MASPFDHHKLGTGQFSVGDAGGLNGKEMVARSPDQSDWHLETAHSSE
jgi:hypothetical protein